MVNVKVETAGMANISAEVELEKENVKSLVLWDCIISQSKTSGEITLEVDGPRIEWVEFMGKKFGEGQDNPPVEILDQMINEGLGIDILEKIEREAEQVSPKTYEEELKKRFKGIF